MNRHLLAVPLACLALLHTACRSITETRDLHREPTDFLQLGVRATGTMEDALIHYKAGRWDKAIRGFEEVRRRARANRHTAHLEQSLDQLLSRSCLGKAEDLLRGRPSAQQRTEALHLLDRAVALDPYNDTAYDRWQRLSGRDDTRWR